LSNRYINDGSRYPVRCGPQALSPVSAAQIQSPSAFIRGTAPVVTTTRIARGNRTGGLFAPQQRVIRYVQRQPVDITPPPGYRLAWDDGRLNPNRGIGTLSGRARMNLIWTQTVPRRLIDTRTGRDVTGLYPRARWPRLPVDPVDRIITPVAGHVDTPRARITAPARVAPQRVATAAATPARATHRYVQVATFAGSTGSHKAAARLQSQGFAVRVAKSTRNGRPVEIVLAGPFTSQTRLTSALAASRRAGYRDAVAVR
jgi:hypothetical protein